MNLLEYLVPSRARREVLQTLCLGRKRGFTVRELSTTSRVAYANVHREVEQMRQLGLVRTERVGNALLCSWNEENPLSKSVRGLLEESPNKPVLRNEETVFGNLKHWGAPLVRRATMAEELSLEETLAYSLELARRHPEVARVWPVVLAKHRREVDLPELESLAYRLGQKKALGFFLSLCGSLMGEPELMARARQLRDARFRKVEDFFLLELGDRARVLAEQNTPKLAKEWFFRMNMPMESFRTFFEKFMPST